LGSRRELTRSIYVRLRPHVRLGPYELESAISEGGLGEVWKANDTSSGRHVALRILPTPPPGDPFRFARFDDDVRKLIWLRHPNVARVYELIDAGDVRALACEWVAGDSLETRLAAGPIPIAETIRIMAQVANGLAAAHARDLVHGDIKPSNIALCTGGTVKVVDLGLVEIYDPGGTTPPSDTRPAPSARLLGAITGTAAYMSPEQIAGHAADSRADVWAFGCVLYEMLTGNPAFGADDLQDTMTRVASTEPEWALIPPEVPALLVQMLRRCMAKDVRRRFQRLTDVLGPIRATIGEEGAVEAFLRQSALGRMSHGRVEPDWSDEGWLESLWKFIPSLKRWAQRRLPRKSALDTTDIIQEVMMQTARRYEGFELKTRSALSTYLRRAVQNRIRDEIRRQGRDITSDAGGVDEDVESDVVVWYREGLEQLNERDRALIESRLDDHATYEEIATRFSFQTAAAARIAVSRAVRKLADLIVKKKRE
jgi:RNA polymerase sigma factor (sigma-70 family)